MGALADIQNCEDIRGIELPNVGVRRVVLPICVQRADQTAIELPVSCSLSASLASVQKGAHMSRFLSVLSGLSKRGLTALDLGEVLSETCEKLESRSAEVELCFRYFIQKEAPISGEQIPMGFVCRTFARQFSDETQVKTEQGLEVLIPAATLCPCSKAISKYGAHNQRAQILVRTIFENDAVHSFSWLEKLIATVETAASSPVFPFLKRVDEKDVTEKQYENPKFVEDVVRDAAKLLQDFSGIAGFYLEVESAESIHPHNVWATYAENYPSDSGFRIEPAGLPESLAPH